MAKITVSRVVGESFDLGTGEALPKAIVLTDGIVELPVYVDDEIALSVISLAHGNGELQEPEPVEAPKKPGKPKKRQRKKVPDAKAPEAVVDETEAYRDELTGVPSL